MGAAAQVARSNPRLSWGRAGQFISSSSDARPEPTTNEAPGEHRWLVDVDALARCRALFAGRPASSSGGPSRASRLPILLDVPPAFDAFCRSHYSAVKRLHPELSWEDACPAYAIALSAHASLHVALDDAREQQLEQSWEDIRGQSGLAWKQARPLIADGCSALDRLDPLAIRR